MIKLYCDICNNEIPCDDDKCCVSIVPMRLAEPHLITLTDVCKDCANSIYHYIKGLKSPLTNQPSRDNICNKETRNESDGHS